MLLFNKKYFLYTIFLFLIEVLIAIFINDSFIRPTLGDMLVVMLIYCLIKTFFNSPPWIIALITLLFAIFVETLQYFHFIEIVGLQNNAVARTIIGTSFSWKDIIAYTVGISVVLIVELAITNFRFRTSD